VLARICFQGFGEAAMLRSFADGLLCGASGRRRALAGGWHAFWSWPPPTLNGIRRSEWRLQRLAFLAALRREAF